VAVARSRPAGLWSLAIFQHEEGKLRRQADCLAGSQLSAQIEERAILPRVPSGDAFPAALSHRGGVLCPARAG